MKKVEQIMIPPDSSLKHLTNEMMLEVFKKGIKQQKNRCIGIEKETFLFDQATKKRLSYSQIKNILYFFLDHGFQGIFEDGNIVGAQSHDISLTLEPGGQFEIAGTPLETLSKAVVEIEGVEDLLNKALKKFKFFKIDCGFDPFWKREDIPWMPKQRYEIMKNYMPKVGSHGLDMMLRTATVQLNLDYTSEENMVKMMRVITALDPLISGLLSASSFVENCRSNYISYRNYVWQHTDEKRCNFNHYVFDKDMGFQKYLNWLLEVPMYFIQRNGYINVAGKSFKDFIVGKLESHKGMIANLDDFYDHMRVAFPKARIKNYIEIRGLDSSPIAMSGVAFWVGLLYGTKFDAIYQEIMNWDPKAINKLGQNIPHLGFKNYSINEKSVWNILQTLFEQSFNELILQKNGEESYLKPLKHLLEKQISYSQTMEFM